MLNKNKIHQHTAFSLFELSIAILMIAMLVLVYIGGVKLVSLSTLAKARALTNSSSVGGIEDLTMWFEATSSKSFTASEAVDGGLVSQWNDINPRLTVAKNVTAAGGVRPTYTANAINGLPALSFNGTTQYLSRANTLGYELLRSNEATVFIVSKATAAQGGVFHFTGNFYLLIPWSDNDIWMAYGGSDRMRIALPALNKWSITSTIKRPNNTGDISVNNSIILSSATMDDIISIPSSTFYLGSYSGIAHHKGFIAELIVFERALTDEERLEVTKYLSKKWGIKIN